MKEDARVITQSNNDKATSENFRQLFKDCPIPENEMLSHLGLYIKRQDMSRMIFFYELYKKIIDVHGVAIMFGVRWGQDIALLETFRGMMEPFNYNRKIIGFDTFEGFPSVSEKDNMSLNKKGDLKVAKGYETYLDKVLRAHEDASPLAHIKKFDLIKGDATKTFKKYLEKHPETIIALAYFDFDIYEPTKACMELCRERFTKGSVIGFDELNHPEWPGETLAVKETLGLNNIRLNRFPFMPTGSYTVIE